MMRIKLYSSALAITLMLLICTANSTAQNAPATTPNDNTRSGPPEISVSTIYTEPKRDPFRGEFKVADEKRVVEHILHALPWPSYEEREIDWRARRAAANKEGRPSPSPNERYLIDEINIVGIYKKPEGSGVFIKPKNATDTTIFALVGEKFYNGRLTKINGNEIEFEEETLWSTNERKINKRVLRYSRGK